jgi:hypothetical protein
VSLKLRTAARLAMEAEIFAHAHASSVDGRVKVAVGNAKGGGYCAIAVTLLDQVANETRRRLLPWPLDGPPSPRFVELSAVWTEANLQMRICRKEMGSSRDEKGSVAYCADLVRYAVRRERRSRTSPT